MKNTSVVELDKMYQNEIDRTSDIEREAASSINEQLAAIANLIDHRSISQVKSVSIKISDNGVYVSMTTKKSAFLRTR